MFTLHTFVFNEISMLDTEPLFKACVPTYSCANTDYCKGNKNKIDKTSIDISIFKPM